MRRIFISLILIFVIAVSATSLTIYKLVKVYVPDKSTFEKVLSVGVDLESSMGRVGDSFELTLSEDEQNILTKMGIVVEVLIDDLEEYYSSRLSKVPYDALGFGYGSMGGYFTYDEVVQQLDTMRLLYPNLITAKYNIGNSLQGRAIWAVKISKDADLPSTNPKVFYNALTHAREPAGMMAVIYFMWYLLQNYGSDTEVTFLMNNRQMYFVPVVNPDGYEANRRINPNGGGMRRKNIRDVVSDDDSYGVDLNRNFGYLWGYDNIGSSPEPNAQTYRGAFAFSEPETQALRDFCLNHKFKFVLNYHTYGNLLIYPWSHIANYLTPDSNIYKEYAHDITQFNKYKYGTTNQALGYITNGGANDWMYGEQTVKDKIFSFLPELGKRLDGFWPSSQRILPICNENLFPNLYVAYAAGNYPKLHQYSVVDRSGDGFLTRGENFSLNITIRNKGLETANNISLSLISSTPDIIIPDQSIYFGSIPTLTNITCSKECYVSKTAQMGKTVKVFANINDQSGIIIKDTLEIFIGIKNITVLFTDSAKTGTNNWDLITNWGLSSDYHSPQYSFTDSPIGNYNNNADNRMTLKNSLNILGADIVTLKFWAKWNIESLWDFALVEVSSNGGKSWTSIQGKYTKLASGYGVQIPETYGYDGIQTNWVEEEMDVTAFASENFKFRFRLRSDVYLNMDGIYVDDITLFVTSIDTTTSIRLMANIGWNLFSLPVEVLNPLKSYLFPTAITHAYAYDESYIIRDTIKRKEGFWLKFNSPQQIEIKGDVLFADTINVQAGWNLIGTISYPILLENIFLEPQDLLSSSFFYYNRYYLIADKLIPGYGYWVKARTNGRIILRIK